MILFPITLLLLLVAGCSYTPQTQQGPASLQIVPPWYYSIRPQPQQHRQRLREPRTRMLPDDRHVPSTLIDVPSRKARPSASSTSTSDGGDSWEDKLQELDRSATELTDQLDQMRRRLNKAR